MRKYLKTDDSVLALLSEKAFLEVCEYYSNPDFWHQVYADELRCFGVSNLPILSEQIREEKEMGETVSDDQFKETVADTGLFTALPSAEGKYDVYAGRKTCYTSMYDRSGTNCRMVTRTANSAKFIALSAEMRGEEVNRGWGTSKELLNIYIPDGKISFFGSEKYKILPFIDGYKAVKEELSSSFPNHKYTEGQIDHEYIYGQWQLNADEEEEYALRMEDLKVIEEGEKTPFFLRYSTSNVGNAKMSARLLVEIQGIQIPLGKPQNIWHHCDKYVEKKELLNHDNGCEISDLSLKLKKLGILMKENEELIEVLGNTDIKHPAGCLQHLLDECSTISAKDKKQAIEDMGALFPTECTAIDVYIMASSLAKNGKSPKQVVHMTEEIAEMQFKNFKLFDKPLEISE